MGLDRAAVGEATIWVCVIAVAALASVAPAQTGPTHPSTVPSTRPATEPSTRPSTQPSAFGLENLSLDELLNTRVTLVSRQPEPVGHAASAIQVITSEEIHRSGALSLPEALRLAPNLQVAQVNAHDWAITARGFNGAPAQNNSFADKLLVMIDGRSVYTPLFGGVFWDVQNVLLEDIDHIEVVSGPGGTLWGANAVNGVINVVTKSARDTQGLYLSQAAGTWWQDFTSVRYGGHIGNDLFYRVYGLGFIHDSTNLASGADVNDNWYMKQTGFRSDYYPTHDNTVTIQGDLYRGAEGDNPTLSDVAGGNLLGRWTHSFSNQSDFTLQMYYDETWRSLPVDTSDEALRTWDVDFQHRFPIGDRNTLVWGMEYRFMRDRINASNTLAFDPRERQLQLFSAFVQDEFQIVPKRVKFTLGTKFEHNDYSGWEFQPSARIAWTPTGRQTVWAAVSRAVRSPARFDQDEVSPVIATPQPFDSEKVTAYELGYRVRPITPLSLSLAGFYNRYDDLRSINTNPNAPPRLVFANDQQADTWGFELSGDLQATPWWHVRGGYTYLGESIRATSAAVVPGADTFEADDPHNQVVVQSMMDLPENIELDLVGRYVDSLPMPHVPSYLTLDARLAWHYRNLELSLVGQNLLDDSHPEFGAQEVPRGVYGRITVTW